jgi:hypothetical protein
VSVTVLDVRHLTATLVFDLEDGYARDRGVAGPHPRPLEPVRYLVVGEVVGGARQDFVEPLELQVRQNSDGYDLFFGRHRLPDGRVVSVLRPGTYVVRVESDLYQAVERDDVMLPEPASPYLFTLEPGASYPFPSGTLIPRSLGPTLLRGVLQDFGGDGVEGATVEVPGQSNTGRTDASGQWVLVFPDSIASGSVTIRFGLPDGTVVQVPAVPIVAGRESTLAPTVLRGVVLTGAGAGITGAAVDVGGPDVARTRRDGSITIVFPLNQAAAVVDVTATLPDGRAQTKAAVPVQPRATVTVPTFRFV